MSRRRAAPPRRSHPASGLVERDAELALLARLAAEAAAGEGRTALIEGPAGLGKTRLLAELRRLAEAGGARVLSARASDLERDYPFGVVRQLLEGVLLDPAAAERALAGAAAPARAVFEFAGSDPADQSGSFAALHGLYWVCVNLAGERPLAVVVDDIHWADSPSLRFLAYLARRLEGLPVLLAATLRTGEPGTDLGADGGDRRGRRDHRDPPGAAQPGGGRGGRAGAARAGRRRRVLPRLPHDDRRQPAAAAPAADARSRRSASSPTRRTPTSCGRSARGRSPPASSGGCRGCPRAPARSARAVAVLGDGAELAPAAALA